MSETAIPVAGPAARDAAGAPSQTLYKADAPSDAPSWKRRLALAFWRRYTRWRVGRSLEGVYVSGLDAVRARLGAGPVVFASTHVAWWDGLVMLLLDEASGADGHFVVDAVSLRRMPWIRAIGAVPIDRTGGARARAGLREATALLDRPGRAVWIFPQGRQRPTHLRPLGIEPGFALLARASGAPVVPVALTYAFREDAKPAAVVHFGDPVAPEGLEAALIDGLARIDTFLDSKMVLPGRGAEPPATPPERRADFTALVSGRTGRADAGVGARLLAWLTGAR